MAQSQWGDMASEALANLPLWSDIKARADANLIHSAQVPSFHKYSQGTGWGNRLCLVYFVLMPDYADDVLDLLDTEAGIRGVSGDDAAKFKGVFEGELQDAAINVGLAQPGNVLVTDVFVDADHAVVKTSVDAELLANASRWYAVEA